MRGTNQSFPLEQVRLILRSILLAVQAHYLQVKYLSCKRQKDENYKPPVTFLSM